jgi:hypothetical protein
MSVADSVCARVWDCEGFCELATLECVQLYSLWPIGCSLQYQAAQFWTFRPLCKYEYGYKLMGTGCPPQHIASYSCL